MGRIVWISFFISGCLLLAVNGSNYLLDRLVDKTTSGAITPLRDVTQQLKDASSKIQEKKKEISQQNIQILKKFSQAPPNCKTPALSLHASILESWDFDSCVTLTDDLRNASVVFALGGQLIGNLSRDARSYVDDIVACPTNSVNAARECYHDNLKSLRDLVADFRNASLPVFTEASRILSFMRLDFDHCIGIPVTSQSALEEELRKCLEDIANQ